MGSSLGPTWQNDINIMPYYLFVPKHILEECGDICETLKTKILPRSFFPLSNQTFHLLHIFAKSFHERYSSLKSCQAGFRIKLKFQKADFPHVMNVVCSITVFKNKLLAKVNAQTNGWCHENHCIKIPSHH